MIEPSDTQVQKRTATAICLIEMKAETGRRLIAREAETIKLFTAARLAGLQAAHHTSLWIPEVHPKHMRSIEIHFGWEEESILLKIEAALIAYSRSGIETEALSAAGAAGIAVFDSLKSQDQTVKIRDLGLIQIAGGLHGQVRSI